MRIRKSQGTADTKWLHFFFFAHLQGLDKATFSTIQYALLYSTSDKKNSHICSKLNNLRRKADSLPALPLPQQSKAGQGACPLWGREAVKPRLLQLWSSGSKLRPCRGLLFPLPGVTQQPMHQWVPIFQQFSKHLLALYLCFVLCIVSFKNDS